MSAAAARRASALALWGLGVASVVGGCREIVGVPSGSALFDLEDPPPLCSCSALEDQPGPGSFAQACRDAYALLPDFGQGAEGSALFASKEDLLDSECRSCSDDAVLLRECYGRLLASAYPGAQPPSGSLGARCEGSTECGSWACCDAPGGGACCASCDGCGRYFNESLAGQTPTLCADDAPLYAELASCLCSKLQAASVAVCATECGDACEAAGPRCFNCILQNQLVVPGTAECDAVVSSCQSSSLARPYARSG